MSDTPPADHAPEFPGRQAAVCLGSLVLVALFLALVLTWRDNGRRAALETTAEFTAVGDAHYYPLPATPPAPPFPAVASLQGQLLYPVDYRRYEFQADDMTRVGVDEKGGYIVYQSQKPEKDEAERKLGPAYYLKISPKEYLKTRAANSGQ